MEETSVPVPLDPVPEDSEDRRLWIGNLDPRITEKYFPCINCNYFFHCWFLLLKLLQQYGSIEKFDLLFHRSGPLEGQPRGYAFITYCSTDCAKLAKEKLNGRIIGNKALSVKWAQNMSKDGLSLKKKIIPEIPALAGAKNKQKLSKATTIQAIEAKLKIMEATSNSLDFEINKKPTTSTNSVSAVSNKFKSKPFVKNKPRPYVKAKFK